MPEPYECCGNGCDACVWVIYFDAQKAYVAETKRRRSVVAAAVAADAAATAAEASEAAEGVPVAGMAAAVTGPS